MMKGNWVLGVVAVITVWFSTGDIYGQTPDSGDPWINTVSMGFTCGFLSFQGDIGTSKTWSSKVFMPAFGLMAEKRAGNTFGFSLNLLAGKISENNSPYEYNYNFRSSVLQADIRGTFHFDNGIIMKKGALFAPFASVGLGYLKFSPAADLKDKNGNPYYYWSDSSIRTEREDGKNHNASITAKDYKYETTLEYSFDDSTSYRKHTYTIPLTAGITVNMTGNFNISIYATWYLTGTDFLDNFRGDSRKDKFLYTGIALQYSFNNTKKVEVPEGTDKFGVHYSELFEDVNWKMLDQSDYDGDGVIDIIDDCPQTPEGLEVYKNGCPLDDDNDGIPNYRDQEPATPKGTNVNTVGEQLIDSIIYFHYLIYVDSLDDYYPEAYRKRYHITVREYESKMNYRIQLYAHSYTDQPNPETIEMIKTLPNHQVEHLENGRIVYTYGSFHTGEEALAKRKEFITQGFNNAILVVKYIPVTK